MPCQEYGNLSTWQAYIGAGKGMAVLMGGDEPGSESHTNNGTVVCLSDY